MEIQFVEIKTDLESESLLCVQCEQTDDCLGRVDRFDIQQTNIGVA